MATGKRHVEHEQTILHDSHNEPQKLNMPTQPHER